DGRVLLFALADMLRCKVQGTTDFISLDDFVNGAFTGNLVGFGTRDSVPVTELAAAPSSAECLVGFGTRDSVPVTELAAAPSPAKRRASARMPAPPIGRKAFQRKVLAPSISTPFASWDDIDITKGAITAGPINVSVSEAKLRTILVTCPEPGRVYPNGDNY